jgi:AraC-like DNA-binding protein
MLPVKLGLIQLYDKFAFNKWLNLQKNCLLLQNRKARGFMAGGRGGFFWGGGADTPSFRVVSVYEKVMTGPPSPSVSRFTLANWALSYTYNGGTRYKIGGGEWKTRKAGALALFPAGCDMTESHAGLTEYPRKSVNLFFIADNCPVLERITERHGHACFEERGGQRIEELLSGAASGAGREEGVSYWKVGAAFCAVMDLLINRSYPLRGEWRAVDSSQAGPSRSEPVRKALDYLRLRAAGTVYLEELAANSNVSVSSLSHKFLEETGETPLRAHMRMKIGLAKEMAISGDPLKVIAERLEFGDVYSLSKAFRRVTGMTAGKFRAASKL